MASLTTVLNDTIRAPNLAWDTVWDGIIGDYAPAAPTEPSNAGGLRARAPLETAILLCWMSDARADPTDEIPDGSGDPRGWAGDFCDPACAPIGSKFWLLRRSVLSDAVAGKAVLYGQQALQCLIDQGACASVKVKAKANLAAGRLELWGGLYEASGALIAQANYQILWTLSAGIQNPLSP